MNDTRYIFITGGVVSGIGKGITSASIGNLLQKMGYKISLLKIDPYINIDPGTLNPREHGEVFVTADGAETDLDLGHYERFTGAPTCKYSVMTTGQVYNSVIKKERAGFYNGKTVQIVPHIIEEIHRRILLLKEKTKPDIIIVEIGGTVGDIESLPFLEAARQIKANLKSFCCHIHLTLIPYLKSSGEIKTKPTQHSVMMLRSVGIIPNIICCRTSNSKNNKNILTKELKQKISKSCGISIEDVIEIPDVDDIYSVPIVLSKSNIHNRICNFLFITNKKIEIDDWEYYIERKNINPKKNIVISIVGKYTECDDAYKSIDESIKHACIANNYSANILKVNCRKLEGGNPNEDEIQKLAISDGIIIPGGFGPNGFEGKILTATWALKNKIPCFGICYGMHAMLVSLSRNLLGLPDANSTEADPATKNPVISLMDSQKNIVKIGGTMRLGEYDCFLLKNSDLNKYYGNHFIKERHRHRWEVNPKYMKKLERLGVREEGKSKNGLTEIIYIKEHPFFIGVQFHPEFKSNPFLPHPLFKMFIHRIIQEKK